MAVRIHCLLSHRNSERSPFNNKRVSDKADGLEVFHLTLRIKESNLTTYSVLEGYIKDFNHGIKVGFGVREKKYCTLCFKFETVKWQKDFLR